MLTVNIKDVAREAGVSVATVSNVINGTKYVSNDLTERVNAAISRLHYEPNPYARGIKGHVTRAIGVVLSKLDQTFFPNLLRGIEEVASKYNYRVIIQYSNYNIDVERSCIRFFLSTNVDGILLNSVATVENDEYYRWLSMVKNGEKAIPIVSLERDLTNYSIDSVCIDNIGGAVTATQHLLQQGCHNIVHIAGPEGFPISDDRAEGFSRVTQENNVSSRIIHGDFTPNSGYACVRSMLNSGTTFDGLFCANDAMAVGALKALREYSIHCPDDVRIVGFDNSYLASLIRPSLSTIHVPQRGIGIRAVELLTQRINRQTSAPTQLEELPIRFISRRSSDPTRSDIWELEL